eukprot:CAMPEP_0169107348 /NCGR_PEP_ID=MMETSP1015-20121227/24836_1 /TAXON_ID=342587 /ORGANISM="Karlodinium micrum, Strain CCMP2283" /LENGTH=200 /DNA_ID=CAMNT_0009168877 /DNA_START=46 /DNA_END=645 /DNA_ORIENTATION=-
MAHAAAAASGARLARRRPVSRPSGGYWTEKQEDDFRERFEAKRQRRLHLAQEEPHQFMRSLGLRMQNGRELTLNVLGHEEVNQCTYYKIKCVLRAPTEERGFLQWHCEKRLCEIRDEFLDMVMEDLGEGYEVMFSQTPFALRGGLPGTTERLKNWFATVATCVNTAKFQDRVCALLLHHLDVDIPISDNAFADAPVHQLS